MKRNVLIFGSIAGLLIATFMVITVGMCYNDPGFEGNMLVGFSAMLVAFSFVFVGIKNYRDKYSNHTITFGNAFKIGLYISLIASTIYVVVWLVDYYMFIPDFMEKYTEHRLRELKASGVSAADYQTQEADIFKEKELYKNPLIVVLYTYLEVLPIGLVVTLISAAILKKGSSKD
jgi:hypothetical protein